MTLRFFCLWTLNMKMTSWPTLVIIGHCSVIIGLVWPYMVICHIFWVKLLSDSSDMSWKSTQLKFWIMILQNHGKIWWRRRFTQIMFWRQRICIIHGENRDNMYLIEKLPINVIDWSDRFSIFQRSCFFAFWGISTLAVQFSCWAEVSQEKTWS